MKPLELHQLLQNCVTKDQQSLADVAVSLQLAMLSGELSPVEMNEHFRLTCAMLWAAGVPPEVVSRGAGDESTADGVHTLFGLLDRMAEHGEDFRKKIQQAADN